MNHDQILRDVLDDHAEQRPDAAEVLAGTYHRISRRKRVQVTRAATMLGAAATVAAVAVASAALAGRSSEHKAAPTRAGAAAAVPAITARPATHVVHAAPAKRSSPASSAANSAPVVDPTSRYGYSTIAAGWLPGPATQVGAQNQPGFEERDYDATVDGVDMDVIIYLERGRHLPSRTEAGANYQDFTINGHPAREFVADVATIVAIDMGNGTIAYAGPSVTATTNAVTTARITEIAVHVARDIQFDRHDPIPAGNGPTTHRVTH
jgi:hypothetical protein